MNPYHEEKQKANYRIKIKGCIIVFFSAIAYVNPESHLSWACWANIGFYTSELIRDFKYYFSLSKLLSRPDGGWKQ